MTKLSSNILKVYLFSFFFMFLVIVPVVVPYFLSLGLTMTEVLFTQAMFGLSLAVFEVPSAYFGDLLGRKKILIMGTFITGLGFSLLFYADNFSSLVIYEIFLAIGASFVSGADLSILYDSLEDKRELKIKSLGNYHAVQLVGESIAAVVCAGLMFYGYRLVVYAQIFVGWIPFILALGFIEPPIERMSRHTHRENFIKVYRVIFKDNKVLTLIFIKMTLASLSTFCAIWLIQKHWQDNNTQLYSLALFWGACNLVAAISGKLAPGWELKYGSKKLLSFLVILPVVSYITMGLIDGLWAMASALFFYIARGINFGILKEAFNHRISSEFRNTANSLVSLFFRLGFFVLGPIIGLLIDSYGLQHTFLILAFGFGVSLSFISIRLFSRL